MCSQLVQVWEACVSVESLNQCLYRCVVKVCKCVQSGFADV